MSHNLYPQDSVKNIINGVALDDSIKANAISALNATIKEIEDCSEIIKNPSNLLFEKNVINKIERLPEKAVIACQGVEGAYSHIACNSTFKEPSIKFLNNFDDVTLAVAKGEAEFGILPVENSSAGAVEDVVEFVCRDKCYITASVAVRVEHCLCAPKGATKKSIKAVYSHPQALRQAARYIRSNSYNPQRETNTATAAKKVADSGDITKGCICSALSAKIYGLDIIEYKVQDQKDNYTKFIVIAKEAYLLPFADTISIAASFENQPGALNRFLTRFSIFNLDLTKIQSMPLGGIDFNVRFHLDFKGDVFDENAKNLLGHMYNIYDDFQFLGNFGQIGPV